MACLVGPLHGGNQDLVSNFPSQSSVEILNCWQRYLSLYFTTYNSVYFKTYNSQQLTGKRYTFLDSMCISSKNKKLQFFNNLWLYFTVYPSSRHNTYTVLSHLQDAQFVFPSSSLPPPLPDKGRGWGQTQG